MYQFIFSFKLFFKSINSLSARVTITSLGLLMFAGCASTPSKMTTQTTHPPVTQVIVKKSERKLELLHDNQIVRQYHVALGGAPVGQKYREGDQRTPIGDYVLNWRNPNSQFYKSIHISYPNEKDKASSRRLGYEPGGMVMLHGLPNYIQSPDMRRDYANRDWTHGCIAVQNNEMDEIWRLVNDGTPIRILP